MSPIETSTHDSEAIKADWLDRLHSLIAVIQGWVEPTGWETRRIASTHEESELGQFEVPLLLMERHGIEVVVVPLHRRTPRAPGVVDLYIMPAYDDLVRLYDDGKQWCISHFRHPEPTVPPFVIEAGRLAFDATSLNRVLDAAVVDA